jgi:hypothetical protein
LGRSAPSDPAREIRRAGDSEVGGAATGAGDDATAHRTRSRAAAGANGSEVAAAAGMRRARASAGRAVVCGVGRSAREAAMLVRGVGGWFESGW